MPSRLRASSFWGDSSDEPISDSCDWLLGRRPTGRASSLCSGSAIRRGLAGADHDLAGRPAGNRPTAFAPIAREPAGNRPRDGRAPVWAGVCLPGDVVLSLLAYGIAPATGDRAGPLLRPRQCPAPVVSRRRIAPMLTITIPYYSGAEYL